MIPLAVAAFFASGFAALLYQVIWQRMLSMFSGTDVYSATVIVAAFMGGLGVGHLVGGQVADRVARRTSLLLFAAAELAIAAFGLFSSTLYYGVLYQQLGPLEFGRGTIAAILFASLLWPTFFMGASLPLLARAVTLRIERAASSVGTLYGFNTLGAAFGALVTTWVLMPRVGLEGGLQMGAALNVLSVAVILPFALQFGRTTADEGNNAAPSPQLSAAGAVHSSRRFWPWVLAYGFAGFLALSFEIVWFRLLGVMVKSTAFTFGTMLTLYLSGIGFGSLAGRGIAAEARSPRFTFLALQGAAGLVAGGLLAVFIGVADDIGALRNYFNSYEPLSMGASLHALGTWALNLLPGPDTSVEFPANYLRLYVAVPFLIVVPPTFLMGCAFPCLQRVVQTDLASIGRRVGTLLLANVVGAMLGAAVTGWFALSVLGTATTLTWLVCLSGVFAVAAALTGRSDASAVTAPWAPRFLAGGVVALLVVGLTTSMPDAATLWARLHGTSVDRMIFAEDNSGLSVLKAAEATLAGPTWVYVNGLGQSLIPYGDIHTALGVLPILVHPDPRQVAIIGLGSGDTLHAAAGRPGIERITGIEIVGSQITSLRALALRNPYGGLHALLGDPRVTHVVGDGRAYLLRTAQRFDVIEADALRPTSVFAGALYSDAYFTLVKSRLAPNGLAATWVPTQRVHDTFVKTFPYVVSLPGILLGSSEPIAFDVSTIATRAADPAVRAHFQRAGIDIEVLLRGYLEQEPPRVGPEFDRTSLTDVNTDLFPRDEFDLSPPR
ncbi:MAG: fused MFS/spermidine synthase [Acidobacteria bacterium]|nr:fused MFS/spermidine synthase [Acidobacteriota bacterium]